MLPCFLERVPAVDGKGYLIVVKVRPFRFAGGSCQGRVIELATTIA